jgi:hypothetical protein
MNIEEELTQSLGKEFQRTIDFDIICDIMVSLQGYAVVEIDYHGPNQRWVDTMSWADTNCTGKFQEHNGKWLFERPEDATMFKLKWA